MSDEMLDTINMMIENMETFHKQVELNAVLAKTAHQSLIKAGFSEQQAMEIIKARGPLLA